MDNVQNNRHVHGCTNPRCQVGWATKFCQVEPNICGSSVRLELHPSDTSNFKVVFIFKKSVDPWSRVL
jgi:hypothetical protein